MTDVFGDPALWFIAREAARDERRAARLGRADGRTLDAFGFPTRGDGLPRGTDAPEPRKRNLEARKRRLQVARWWAHARREWEAEVAECRRRACDEFAILLPVGDWAEAARDVGRPLKNVVRLLVTGVNLRPVSERGEPKNGVDVTFEADACGKRGIALADRSAGFTETFGWPSRLHKDGGALASRRLARLGLATGVIGPDAPGTVVPVGWREMAGRRLAASVRRETLAGEEGETVLTRIDGLKMWPVTPPFAHE